MAEFSPVQLEACLLQLTNPDTTKIKEAEAALKPFLKQQSSVAALLQQLQQSDKPEVRQLAGLMLRKRVLKHWPKMDDASKASAKQTLLARAGEEPVHVVRSTIASLISTLALHEVPTGSWPELMIFINQSSSSATEQQREMSMSLLQLLGESMGTELQPHFNDLKQLFANALQDPQSLKVRVAGMRAACGLIDFLEDDDLREFRNLVPLMVQVLQQCVSNGAETEAVEFLDVFSEIASHPFPVLDQSFAPFMELLVQIVLHDNLEASTRASASYAIGEFLKRKPKTVGKKELVPKIFTAMLDIVANDDEVSCGLISSMLQKDVSDEDDGDDDEGPGHLAQQTLDTLALNIPAKYLNNVVFGICSEYMQSPDAQKRKAGVLALGILSEGCCEFMCRNIRELLPPVYRVAQDENQRVREAAGFALGQFAEFLQPTIVDHFGDILPLGIALLDDQTKEIKATALYIVDEITQSMDAHQMHAYLDTLMAKLVNVLRTSPPQLQKMALDAIGSIAIGSKEAFQPYFQTVAELIQPLWNITDPKFFMLRGAAIECLGYLATALGSDAFRPYLAPSMPFVFQSFEIDDSELKEQAFVYFINVSSIFKDEFAPFLEQAATQILQELQNEDGLNVMQDDDDVLNGFGSEDEDEEDEGLVRHVSIRTDALNAKVRAISAVEQLALNVGGIFDPFIPKFLEALAPLSEYIHEDVRGAVAEALSALVVCSFDAAHGNPDSQVWTKGDLNMEILTPNNKIILDAVMKSLINDLMQDTEEEVVEKAFTGVKNVAARVGPAATVDYMQELMKNVQVVLNHEHLCQADAEVLEGDDEETDGGSVLEAASELVGVLGKCYGEHFLSTFQEIFPKLLSFTTGLHSGRDRAAVVGCFAEVIRELGPSALGFVESVFPVVIQSLTGDNLVLRANSAFCLGILAEVSGDKLFSAYEQMLTALRPLFDNENNDGVVVDNACAAVARMMLAGGAQHVPVEHVLPVMLQAMPLQVDADESPIVFRCLNGLVQAQNPATMNVMPQVLEVYAKALQPTSNVAEKEKEDIKQCVRSLMGTYEAQMKDVIGKMSPEYQHALGSALN